MQASPVVMWLFHADLWPISLRRAQFVLSQQLLALRFRMFFCCCTEWLIRVKIKNTPLETSSGNSILNFPCMTSLCCEIAFQDAGLFFSFLFLNQDLLVSWICQEGRRAMHIFISHFEGYKTLDNMWVEHHFKSLRWWVILYVFTHICVDIVRVWSLQDGAGFHTRKYFFLFSPHLSLSLCV